MKIKNIKLRFVSATLVFVLFAGPVNLLGAASLNDVVSKLNKLSNKVNSIQSNVSQVRSDTLETTKLIQAGVDTLTGDMKDEISSVISEIESQMADIKADREAFDPKADQFKETFIEMLKDFDQLRIEISVFTDLPSPIKTFEKEIRLIDSLPNKLLSPLYYALVSEKADGFHAFCKLLEISADSMKELNASVSGPDEYMVVYSERVDQAISVISKLGILCKGMGAALKAKGDTGVTTKEVQLHGYVGMAIESDYPSMFGNFFDGIASALESIASSTESKMRHLITLNEIGLVMDKVEGINIDMENLDTSVSSRASQESVDAIQVSLDAIAVIQSESGNSGVEIVQAIETRVNELGNDLALQMTSLTGGFDSRASQESINALSSKLDAGSSASLIASQSSIDELTEKSDNDAFLALRIELERQLIGNEPVISLFYLPEANGGMLEYVREFVSAVVASHQNAGFALGESVFQSLGGGDAALELNDYATAFEGFRDAYQETLKSASISR